MNEDDMLGRHLRNETAILHKVHVRREGYVIDKTIEWLLATFPSKIHKQATSEFELPQ